MATERLFVAVELPDDVLQALVKAQRQLRSAGPDVAWVAPAAMHLTLVFLGETPSELLPQIGALLRQAAAGTPPLDLRLGRVGAFPSLRRPSVLWVGVGGATDALARLQSAIADALEPLGVRREARPFRPHLTLGRGRRDAATAQQARLAAALPAVTLPPLAWRAERVVLFQSELRPGGPRYTERAAVDL